MQWETNDLIYLKVFKIFGWTLSSFNDALMVSLVFEDAQ